MSSFLFSFSQRKNETNLLSSIPEWKESLLFLRRMFGNLKVIISLLEMKIKVTVIGIRLCHGISSSGNTESPLTNHRKRSETNNPRRCWVRMKNTSLITASLAQAMWHPHMDHDAKKSTVNWGRCQIPFIPLILFLLSIKRHGSWNIQSHALRE